MKKKILISSAAYAAYTSRVLFSIMAIAVFFLLGPFVADAQTTGPKDECTLVRKVNGTFSSKVAGDKSIIAVHDGVTVASSVAKLKGGDKDGKSVTFADGTLGGLAGTLSTGQKEAITKSWGTICLINTINSVVNWIFLLLLVTAVAFLAIAGFLWMTGGAKPDHRKMAGTMILGAIIGIVIAVLARILPSVVTGIML